MEKKYIMIFLTLLLCSLNIVDSFAQRCISVKYDKNGNRVELSVTRNLDKEESLDINSVASDEISDNQLNDRILLYPNPNNGYFNISVDDNDEFDATTIEIYNNIGVKLYTNQFTNNISVDISDNPSGLYLLRIVKDDIICNKIVVKF